MGTRFRLPATAASLLSDRTPFSPAWSALREYLEDGPLKNELSMSTIGLPKLVALSSSSQNSAHVPATSRQVQRYASVTRLAGPIDRLVEAAYLGVGS